MTTNDSINPKSVYVSGWLQSIPHKMAYMDSAIITEVELHWESKSFAWATYAKVNGKEATSEELDYINDSMHDVIYEVANS